MLSNAEIEGIFTQEALRVYFIADGVDIPLVYMHINICVDIGMRAILSF